MMRLKIEKKEIQNESESEKESKSERERGTEYAIKKSILAKLFVFVGV